MAMLNEARADDKSFPAGLTIVLGTLTYNRGTMSRYFAVRIYMTDARQLPCDSEQGWIDVQGWNDLSGEAWARVYARWRDCAKHRSQLNAERELEVCLRQDRRKYH
jgi:hypothetical protein